MKLKFTKDYTGLLQLDMPWDFNEQCQHAFTILKRNFVTVPTFHQSEWEKEVRIFVHEIFTVE